MAVLIANDRPARKRGEEPHYLYGAEHQVISPPRSKSADRAIQANTTIEGTPFDGSHGSDYQIELSRPDRKLPERRRSQYFFSDDQGDPGKNFASGASVES